MLLMEISRWKSLHLRQDYKLCSKEFPGERGCSAVLLFSSSLACSGNYSKILTEWAKCDLPSFLFIVNFLFANANHYHYAFGKGKFMKNKYIIAPGIAVMCSAVISSGYASSDKKKIRLLLPPPGSLSSSEMPRPVSQSLLQNNCKKNRFQIWSMQ